MSFGRATLQLSLNCDNRCVFCAQDGLAPHELGGDALDAALRTLRGSADELTFVGGEPALSTHLVGAIERARSLGFVKVGVQTNGNVLGASAALLPLVTAGLTDVHFSVHGCEPAVHDYHTGAPGSFARVLGALHAARARGLTVVVSTALSRSTFRVLSPMPAFLRQREVAAWCLEVLHARGRAEEGFDRIVPRLGLALPFALHAVESARRLGLPAFVRGAPLCAMGPLARRALASAPRVYGQPCEPCVAKGACPGLDAKYLTRFGASELTTLAVHPPASEMPPELGRMFVGVGEMFGLAGDRGLSAEVRLRIID